MSVVDRSPSTSNFLGGLVRFCSFIFCLLSLLSTPFPAFGQTVSSSVRRDSDAISVLTKSIQALGGLPSTKVVSSCTASGQALIFRGGSQSGPPASFVETDTLNGHVWDLIGNRGGSFHRCRIDPVLDHPRHDRTGHDRLPDDYVPPGG